MGNSTLRVLRLKSAWSNCHPALRHHASPDAPMLWQCMDIWSLHVSPFRMSHWNCGESWCKQPKYQGIPTLLASVSSFHPVFGTEEAAPWDFRYKLQWHKVSPEQGFGSCSWGPRYKIVVHWPSNLQGTKSPQWFLKLRDICFCKFWGRLWWW